MEILISAFSAYPYLILLCASHNSTSCQPSSSDLLTPSLHILDNMANFEDRDHAEANHKLNNEDPLERIKASQTVTLTPELFEKLYLSPQNQVKGELRKTFGNPTPM